MVALGHTPSNGPAGLAAEVSGVWFAYEDTAPVLRGISFAANQGEAHCIMGPNGCGKSTLLDCVLGFNRPQEGSVTIQGAEVVKRSPADLARQVAYVPQAYTGSFPYLVEQVVLMGRASYQRGLAAPDDRDHEVVAESLDAVGITRLAKRPYTQLSGGETQLVLLARALAQRTPLIVMDEPAAHLDLRNSVRFLEIVSQLVVDHGVTVLMATHHHEQPFFLESVGCPVAVSLMRDGEIMASGAPAETITEASLRDVFRVEAALLTSDPGDAVRRRGFVPISSLDEGEIHGAQ